MGEVTSSHAHVAVLVVGGHVIWTEGLAVLIDDIPGMHAVGVARGISDALRMVDQHHPDVVLVQVDPMTRSNAGIAHALQSRGNRAKIALLTDESSVDAYRDALDAGVVAVARLGSLATASVEHLVRMVYRRPTAVRVSQEGGTEELLTEAEVHLLEKMHGNGAPSAADGEPSVAGIAQKFGLDGDVDLRQRVLDEAVRRDIIVSA